MPISTAIIALNKLTVRDKNKPLTKFSVSYNRSRTLIDCLSVNEDKNDAV